MTISGYSNAIVDVMLGWLKGLANWVLRLFNLAGSVSTSPLLWLSQNWLKLLIFFLVLGVVLDRLVWLIRWRPYWVWFRKERVIVNDDRFFKDADIDSPDDWEGDLRSNWDERDYVVASTVVKRQKASGGRGAVVKDGRRPAQRRDAQPGCRREGTRVERHVDRDGQAQSRRSEAPAGACADRQEAERRRGEVKRSGDADSIFAVELNKPDVSDFYEDEVFNVSNLPEYPDDRD